MGMLSDQTEEDFKREVRVPSELYRLVLFRRPAALRKSGFPKIYKHGLIREVKSLSQ